MQPQAVIRKLTWNSADERYRSPKLGSTVTTSLPLFSGRLATCRVIGWNRYQLMRICGPLHNAADTTTMPYFTQRSQTMLQLGNGCAAMVCRAHLQRCCDGSS